MSPVFVSALTERGIAVAIESRMAPPQGRLDSKIIENPVCDGVLASAWRASDYAKHAIAPEQGEKHGNSLGQIYDQGAGSDPAGN